MARSLYDILGVAKSASDAEISKAYRKLAKGSHPDLHPGDKKAEARFKEITAAYDILGDKDKRARYDRGEIDEEGRERGFAGGQGFGGFGRRRPAGEGQQFEFRTGPGGGFQFDDILSEIFGAGGPGGRRRDAAGGGFAVRGEDLRFTLDVDFVDAARGAVRRVSLPDGGTLDVTIPAGLESGQVLRLRGKGRPGIGGGDPGDALVEVRVNEHKLFRRDGLDIRIDQPVPLEIAVLGGRVRVPTLAGEVSVAVPKGSSSGRILRLRGKGIRGAKGARHGDQLVRVMIELPHHDADLEAWAKRRSSVSA